MLKSADTVFELMNIYGRESKPFLFGIDYDVKNGFFFDPKEAYSNGVLFAINGIGFDAAVKPDTKAVELVKHPVDMQSYKKAFDIVHRNLIGGNSYLTNLTFPTAIDLNLSLPEIFSRSQARYRLLFDDRFVVFSPEIFVKIEDGLIRSFPMKGTIDASLPDAENSILNNAKETAEHNTIVDLIRNDLSMIASDVTVERFRYIEKIVTHTKSLLQVSSEICGVLPENHLHELGTLFKKLLPAGSICGAPKKKTLQIIQEAETYKRGFYTGVFGYFDGEKLDSGVMIRFIGNHNGKLTFYSGGGITVNSNMIEEYNELIDKVYVPIV